MRLHSVDIKQISIKDNFWSKHVDLVRNAIIPYQWEAMNDRIEDAESSHCLANFRIAAGREEGDFYGAVFQDTDIAKWLEAVGFSLACYPDAELEKTADEVIDLIAEAQCDDGYINTYFTIKEPDKRWTDLCSGHELYTAGHLMEAAVAYYQGTGKRKFLDCMCKFADLIIETFGYGEGQIPGYPGHEEVEIGLIKLYHVTGEKKYLDQAKYFVDARGVDGNYFFDKEFTRPDHKHIFPEFADYTAAYAQAHLPVREQTTAEGHAVRAVYLYMAMADLAEAYDDEGLKKACEILWNNITERRMYLTGGIGSSGHLERFTVDYDLPNEYNYSESCASIGLALFGLRMNQITGESKYMDVAERALYNTVLAGIALDGKSFFYVNPLEVYPPACMDGTSKKHVKNIRQKWFGVACCPPNIARTLASLGQYIYAVSEEKKQLYVNLFVSNESEISMREDTVSVKLETRFPYENTIAMQVKNVPADGMELYFRVPDYAENYRVLVNGAVMGEKTAQGYWKVVLEEDSQVEVSFEAPAHYVYANPQVRADAGKAAIVRGPLVYCLEECDNGAILPSISADTDAELTEEISELFGGCVVVKGKGKRIKESSWTGSLYGTKKPETEDVEFTAIPYPYWNNRGIGEMMVWLRMM